MRKLAFSLFLAVILAVSTLALATPARATGATCPHGNVKWEQGSGYEYTDGSATVSGNADQVTVAPAEGFEVVGVCIKIGGPGGGETMSFTSAGTFGPFDHGISHVVVTTRPATPPPPPPGVNTLTVTPTVDCEGWSILIEASESASIFFGNGANGNWSQTTSVLVTVVATWTNGEPLSIEWSETLSMPEDCGVVPPPPPPPPQNTPVPPPWRPGAYACTVYTGVTTGTYEVFWLDGAGAIGGLSQPAQALDPDGGAQIFFTNTGNYVIVANGQVVAQFSMPGCAPMDAPPATPAPPTGTGGPSVSSSLATGGAALAFLAVLFGGALLFFVPRRDQG